MRFLHVALCSSLVIGCQSATNDIVIGTYASLTGSTATFGQAQFEGVLLATEERNAQGGLLGKKIKLVIEDDQSRPELAKLAVLKLIKQHKASAILGEVASSRSLAAAPECQRQRIPMISPSSTHPSLTEVGDYIFRTCFIDPFQGGAMARFARHNLHLTKVAVFKDAKNDYSVGLASFFRAAFESDGGTIVAEEAYGEGDIEFRSQLANIKRMNPEAIYIPGYYTELGLIARQARELGITAPFLGGDGWDSPKTIEIGGSTVDGTYFTNHYAADDPNPRTKDFIDRYQTRFGHQPDAIGVLSYDAANLLYDGILRAQTINSATLRDAIATTKNFPGIVGSISLDEHRNARKPIVIVQIQNGKFTFKGGEMP